MGSKQQGYRDAQMDLIFKIFFVVKIYYLFKRNIKLLWQRRWNAYYFKHTEYNNTNKQSIQINQG